MTDTTNCTCSKCHAVYELVYWNLGHKDSDSIDCPHCGAVLKAWRKEARSYSVRETLQPGDPALKIP